MRSSSSEEEVQYQDAGSAGSDGECVPEFMGGVDALDALIAYYRIHIRSKKYYHRFFFHFVDMVVVNGWLLYRRDCDSMNVPRKKQKDLLAFKLSIAQALCMQGKDLSAKKAFV